MTLCDNRSTSNRTAVAGQGSCNGHGLEPGFNLNETSSADMLLDTT